MLRFVHRSQSVPRQRRAIEKCSRMLLATASTSKPTPATPKPSGESADGGGGPKQQEQKRGGSGFKYVLYGVTGLAAAGSITVLLADNSRSARQSIESQLPGADRFFAAYLGRPGDKVVWNAVKRKVSGDGSTSESSDNKSMLPQISLKPSEPSASDSELQLDGVSKEQALKSWSYLRERFDSATNSADKKLKKLMETNRVLVEQINSHARTIRKAINDPTDRNWAHVAQTKSEVEQTLRQRAQQEADANNYVDLLKTVVKQGSESSNTAGDPVLEQAKQVIGDMVYRKNQSELSVQQAQQENKVMSEYKQLIEQSRRQFAEELRAIVPDIEKHAKDNKLSLEELNALIAHAHLRIDHLRKQVTEQKLREEQHIHEALQRQKIVGGKLTDEQLEKELKRMEVSYQLDAEHKLNQARIDFESELRAQLRKASVAHAEHLESELSKQEAELSARAEQLVQEAVKTERQHFQTQMAETFEKLNAVEAALAARAQQDIENRRAKQLWLACQNLTDSIVNGNKSAPNEDARRKPLGSEMVAIREASASDPFVHSIFESINQDVIEAGVYTEEDLRSRFLKLERVCRRTALIDENGGSLWQYAVSALQSMALLNIRKSYTSEDVIDVNNVDTHEIIERARYHLLKQDDLQTAVRLLSLLRGEPALLARDWVRDARHHLEARQAAQLLQAHAASLSCDSLY